MVMVMVMVMIMRLMMMWVLRPHSSVASRRRDNLPTKEGLLG